MIIIVVTKMIEKKWKEKHCHVLFNFMFCFLRCVFIISASPQKFVAPEQNTMLFSAQKLINIILGIVLGTVLKDKNLHTCTFSTAPL